MAKSPQTTKKLHPFSTAVGKKIISAITGLALCIYLIGHLAGNLTLLWPGVNGQVFNSYANFLTSLPFLLAIEVGLAALFLIHAWEGFQIWRENKAARGSQEYYYKTWARTKSSKSRKTVSSTTMMVTGLAVLIFTVLHVWHFKFGKEYQVGEGTTAHSVVLNPVGGVAATQADSPAEAKAHVRDLARLVVEEFKKPLIVLLYVLSMLLLGTHLYHAVSSSFQSLGLQNRKFSGAVMFLGRAFTIVIAGGFTLLPLYVYFFVNEVPR